SRIPCFQKCNMAYRCVSCFDEVSLKVDREIIRLSFAYLFTKIGIITVVLDHIAEEQLRKAERALQEFKESKRRQRLEELEEKELDDEELSEREERVLTRLRLEKTQLKKNRGIVWSRWKMIVLISVPLLDSESERALKRPPDQLKPFINAQLLCKLPTSKHEEEQYPELLELVYTNEDDSYSDLASHVSVALSRQFNDNVSDIESEDDLHHVINSLIKDTLRLFSRNAVPGSLDLLICRNTVDMGWTTTTIGTCRPDFLVYHKNVLVLKGEEKATPNSFHKALSDLTDKKSASMLLTITVISVTINILRILVTIGPYLSNDVIPLYILIQQASGSTITFYDDSVVKELSFQYLPYVDGSLRKRIAFLREILIMTTRGIRRLPCNETELRSMVRSLLVRLDCLHSGNYVHHDIREPNVLFVPENPAGSKYVLIDFEHGVKANKEMNERLSDWNHRTLSNNQYTTLSDIYQLGKLIERLIMRFQMSISDNGKTFVNKLKKKKMNATQALQHAWITDVNFP
ncbi:1208_t:CDS:10, partial [Funneliformis caledonium]